MRIAHRNDDSKNGSAIFTAGTITRYRARFFFRTPHEIARLPFSGMLDFDALWKNRFDHLGVALSHGASVLQALELVWRGPIRQTAAFRIIVMEEGKKHTRFGQAGTKLEKLTRSFFV